MTQIRDALELLTAQHEELDGLFDIVSRTRDAATFDELSEKLTTHLALEQELLYPVVARELSPDVMSELIAEHIAIKRLLSELVWIDVDDEEFPDLFAALGDLMVGHTSWQEDQLFTDAAERLSPAQLQALGDQLSAFGVDAVAAAA